MAGFADIPVGSLAYLLDKRVGRNNVGALIRRDSRTHVEMIGRDNGWTNDRLGLIEIKVVILEEVDSQ